MYRLSPREQTCHQGNSFGGAKACRCIYKTERLVVAGFLIGEEPILWLESGLPFKNVIKHHLLFEFKPKQSVFNFL